MYIHKYFLTETMVHHGDFFSHAFLLWKLSIFGMTNTKYTTTTTSKMRIFAYHVFILEALEQAVFMLFSLLNLSHCIVWCHIGAILTADADWQMQSRTAVEHVPGWWRGGGCESKKRAMSKRFHRVSSCSHMLWQQVMLSKY